MKKYLKISFIILCFFITSNKGLNFIPDSQNPLTIMFPESSSNKNILTMRFSFPEKSLGVNHKQFIGVVFTPDLGTDLKYDDIEPKFKCEMKDSNNLTYKLTPVASVKGITPDQIAESHIAYCRLDEMVNLPLKVGEDTKYELKIYLGVKISVSYMKGVGLLTSTSNNPSKIIIDYSVFLATAAIYPDHTVHSGYKALSIAMATIKITSGNKIGQESIMTHSTIKTVTTITSSNPLAIVYPYNNFDLSVVLISGIKNLIVTRDAILAVRFPLDTVEPPQSVTTDEFTYNGQKIDKLITENYGLRLVKIPNTDIYQILGWTEDLNANRIFKLNFLNFKALDTNLTTRTPIEIFLFYKNSYNIYSYDKMNVFKVESATLTLRVRHPENWDIWRNGAWPLDFYVSSNIDLTNGGFLSLQHSNTQENLNRINLMPSTCDFSQWTGMNNEFGKRPNCYSLRYDYFYPDTQKLLPFLGSGVFFQIPTMMKYVEYKFSMWGFADNCGGPNFFDAYNPNSKDKSFVYFKFQITLYKNINPLLSDEKRLINSSNIIMGSSSEATMTSKCWNNKISFSSTLPMFFELDQMQRYISLDSEGLGNDHILFKEITDFSISQQLNAYSCDDNNNLTECFGYNIGINTITEKFLYSNTLQISPNSYFLISFILPKTSINNLITAMPLNYYKSNTGNDELTSGRLILQFPAKFFAVGDSYSGTGENDGCYLSWGLHNTGAANSQLRLIQDRSYVENLDLTEANLISSKIGTIDATLTNIIATDTKPIRIVSSLFRGSVLKESDNLNKFFFMKDYKTEGLDGKFTVGLFTSCIKWYIPQDITSLYLNLDIQLQWNYAVNTDTSSIGVPSKNIRFIKLFAEGGVFNDFTNNFSYPIPETNPIRTHMVYGDNSQSGTVCLLEISGSLISNSYTSDGLSKTLAVWITYGTLFETDYTDASATYPAAPLKYGINAYGLQAPGLMTTENNYCNDGGVAIKNFDKLISNVNSFPNVSPFGNNKSSYYHLLGNVVLITGVKDNIVTGDNSNPNLLIPFYCPLNSPRTTNGVFIYASTSLPTVYATWLDMTQYNKINKVKSILSWKYSDDKKYTIFLPNPKKIFSVFPAGVKQYDAVLRFAPYTFKTDTTNLYIFNNDSSNQQMTCTGQILLLNQSLKFDKNINLMGVQFTPVIGVYPIPNPEDTTTNNTNKVLSSFYVFNIPFHQAVLAGIGNTTTLTGNIKKSTTNNPTSPYFFTGIKRPSFEEFINLNTNKFLTTNNVGYFCVNNDSYDLNYFTNYQKIIQTNLTVKYVFVLDYGTDLITKWGTSSFGMDISKLQNTEQSDTNVIDNSTSTMQFIQNDSGGNIYLNIETPVEIPVGSYINLISDNFNIGTQCGIENSDTKLFASECENILSINNNVLIKCPSNKYIKRFRICCFNINIEEEIKLSDLFISYKIDSSVENLKTYLASKIYSTNITSNSLNNPYSFIIPTTAKMTEINKQFKATVTDITYHHVLQEGGIGKMTMVITLPRKAVRNMKIVLEGDFSGIVVPSVKPRCEVTFWSTDKNNDEKNMNEKFHNIGSKGWQEGGDALLENCSVGTIENSRSDGIVITTKKLVYKCGFQFHNKINLTLWPVLITNWNKPPFLLNNYRVLMQLNTETIINLSSNILQFNMHYPKQLKPQPLKNSFKDLCNLSITSGRNIPPQPVPRVPGFIADYQFDFDIKNNYQLLTNSVIPNELTIFFPYDYFGSHFEKIICYMTDMTIINCSFSDEGILNIKFPVSILNYISTDSTFFSVIISGIRNPNLEFDLMFACSINQTNYEKGERINLIVGAGKIIGGDTMKSAPYVSGIIRFTSIRITPNPISDVNPRATANYIFRIAFDFSTGISQEPINVSNTPILFIYFPNNYNLGNYQDVKITSQIDEYTSDQNDNLTRSNIHIPSVRQLGNTFQLTFPVPSIFLNSNWRFWEITLRNIVNPSEETRNIYDVKKYHFLLTNMNYNSIFRTVDNLDTLNMTERLETPIDFFITNVRGYYFKFDSNKWVIDVLEKQIPNTTNNVYNIIPNVLTIFPGRFLKASFVLKNKYFQNVNNNSTNASKQLTPAMTILTLSDRIFITTLTQFTISTSIPEPVDFLIGVSCGTASGNYIIKFSSSNQSDFARIVPLEITINDSIKGSIFYKHSGSVSLAGSNFINYFLSESNVDEISIKWKYGDHHKNDKTAIISPAIIPRYSQINPAINLSKIRSVFTILNSEVITEQIFKTQDPNGCYTWENPIIKVNINGNPNDKSVKDIQKNDNLELKLFFIYNKDDLNKNSIKINFNPPYQRIFLFCALICNNQSYPDDNTILTSSNSDDSDSPQLRYFSNYFINTNQTEIVFSNLIRGQKYKMKCLLQSDEADLKKRKTFNMTMDTISNKLVKTQDLLDVKCIEFNFKKDPGTTVKNKMIEYCQNLYSQDGFYNNGCIICTDENKKILNPGLNFRDDLKCVPDRIKNVQMRFEQTKFRNLQNNSIINLVNTNTTNSTTINTPILTSFFICPIPMSTCGTDYYIKDKKTYDQVFKTLSEDFKTGDMIFSNLKLNIGREKPIDLFSTRIVSDLKAPNPLLLSVTNVYYDPSGHIKWINTYSLEPIKCFWQIVSCHKDYLVNFNNTISDITPTYDQISACNDISWCGLTSADSKGITVNNKRIELNLEILRSFDKDYTYFIFYACLNDIPFPQKPTEVFQVYNFTNPN